MASRNTPCWEAPIFSFTSQNQAEDWKLFYTRALDFLKALDINPDGEDKGKKGWCQIKMMFQGDDCQAPQTLINNNTISCEIQHTPTLALKVIQPVIKEDVHFWHYHDEILADICQFQSECIHSLSTRINTLFGKCKFPTVEIKETIKVMALHHVVKYHKTRDCIHSQDQSTLSYWSLVAHCKQLETCCEQFQQAQAKGRAHLTSITLTSANHSSLHANAQSTTTHQSCSQCGYSHPCASYPDIRQVCYNCHSTGHSCSMQETPT